MTAPTKRMRRSEASGLRRAHFHRSRVAAARTPVDGIARALDYFAAQAAHVADDVADRQARHVIRALMGAAEQMETDRPRAGRR